MARRTSPPRPPAGPPASPEIGAAFVRDYVVKLYDRQNGEGVKWETIAATLFRAAFDVLRELPPPQKQAFADRVHQRAYEAMTDDPAPVTANPANMPGAHAAPANEPRPAPPR